MVCARKKYPNSPHQHLLQAQYSLALQLFKLDDPVLKDTHSPTPLARRGEIIKMPKEKKITVIIVNELNKIETKNNNDIEKETENAGFEPLTPDVQFLKQ